MATRVASIVADVGINTKSFDSGMKSILGGLKMSQSEMAKWGAAIGIAGVALGMIYAQGKKAVDITVTYADEVRKLSSVTNQSAEDTSRLIQMMDDYKLTAEQAGQAARFLAKQGLSLNVETLADLSDKYKALNTGQERAAFLMKNFGKAGQEFTTIMEAGGVAIKNNADATGKNLILTQKMLTATRDYEIAQDNLNDTMDGFYVVVGSKIIPSLNQMMVGLTNAGNFSRALRIEIEKIENAPIDSATQSYTAWAEAISKAKKPIVDVETTLYGLDDAEQSFLTSTQNMTPQIVAEFVKAEQKIAQVKKLIASGASFNVIVNFLAGKTIMVDPSKMSPQNPVATATTKVTGGGAGTSKGNTNRANGGPLGKGWTMVGEAGFELIDPTGMVHSNKDSRKLIKAGVTPFRKMAQGGEDWGRVTQTPTPWDWSNSSNDVNATLAPSWTPSSPGSHSGGSGGSSGAVINTAKQAATSASQAAQQTSRAVDVTAQSAQQQAMASAAQAASLANIERLLRNMPNQIRDGFQQVIQQ
jgi:hypothetical protein